MVDVNPQIYDSLKGLCRVSMEFPTTSESFPVITISEVTNLTDYSTDGREMLSAVTVQLDVWDNGENMQKLKEIAAQASAVMIQNRYSRVQARAFRDESGLYRETMQFKNYFFN